jgi:hypothetical protein
MGALNSLLLCTIQYEALGYVVGGLGLFGGLGVLALYNNKPSKKPYVRYSPDVPASLCLPEFLGVIRRDREA